MIECHIIRKENLLASALFSFVDAVLGNRSHQVRDDIKVVQRHHIIGWIDVGGESY